MINTIRKILKPKYQPLNTVEVLKDNLIHNLKYLHSLQKQSEIFPVLKSNAYGHGLKEVCKILNKTEVRMVVVDSFPEAQVVYHNFKGKVLILGEMPHKTYDYCRLNRTEFVVYSQETLRYLSKYGKKIKVHLFYNTGMNREGIDDLQEFINNNKKYLNKIDIGGFCSHLAEVDDPESHFTEKQEKKFLNGLEILKKNNINPNHLHLGNSGGVFNLNNKKYNAFRVGVSFYGYSPFKLGSNNDIRVDNLKPALRLSSKIVAKHKLDPGERISYGNSFTLKEKSNIAIIPFGYFEGLDKRFSNCAKFLYNDNKNVLWGEVVGKICMNLSCLNFGDKELNIGDRVEIVSEIKNNDNSLENLSKKIGISNYEFLVNLNSGIKKVII